MKCFGSVRRRHVVCIGTTEWHGEYSGRRRRYRHRCGRRRRCRRCRRDVAPGGRRRCHETAIARGSQTAAAAAAAVQRVAKTCVGGENRPIRDHDDDDGRDGDDAGPAHVMHPHAIYTVRTDGMRPVPCSALAAAATAVVALALVAGQFGPTCSTPVVPRPRPGGLYTRFSTQTGGSRHVSAPPTTRHVALVYVLVVGEGGRMRGGSMGSGLSCPSEN